ncbi:TetR/AcrR family transcriptional regulator [Streptosporangium sp. NPDC000396]|uniref:TetR/AcrR family transcriptional regulator n=1 Tax=Streptosporangium sp. NPDC000396 TaxID=3366185 RepID=UPI0036C7A1C5
MEEERQPARRPGGRSARIRAAVHQAVTDLVAERGYGNFTVGEVAARAGVADTSIYRRWGTLEALTMDVAITWLTTTSPIPDTGSLDGDLRAYAANVARDVTGPDGLAVLRLVIALSTAGDDGMRARDAFLAERSRQLQIMLDRARDRGERPPDALDVLDHILAPMYIRILFGAGLLDPDYVNTLVDHLLSLTGTPGSGRTDAIRPPRERTPQPHPARDEPRR